MAERLGELILYVAEKCQDDSSFGAIKLNKLLFLVDFVAYGAWGKSISGATYIRLPKGPVPYELPIVRDQLIIEGRAAIQTRKHFGYDQKRIVPLVPADESVFTPDELRLVDQMISNCARLNATQISEWSHTLLPWLAARDKEEIPYETVFALHRVPVGSEGIQWGLSRLNALQTEDRAAC